MISEKTVELNITTELVNWLFHKSGVRPYILAPSQRQEGVLGFDVAMGFPITGTPYLLQYKRAEFRVTTDEYVYHINTNKARDQHARLFLLERMGWSVFYVFPLFHLASQVIDHRQHLLPMTLYVKPGAMRPAGGILTGRHEVRYNRATGSMTIHSDEGKNVEEYWELGDFVDLYLEQTSNRLLKDFAMDFNTVFTNEQELIVEDSKIQRVSEQDHYLFNGMAAIVK